MLVRDGNECAYLPFVLEGTLRVFKTSETGKELTLYGQRARGKLHPHSDVHPRNGSRFPAIAEAEQDRGPSRAPALAGFVEEYAEWRRFVFGLFGADWRVLSLVEEVAFHHVDTRIAAFLMKSAEKEPGVLGHMPRSRPSLEHHARL